MSDRGRGAACTEVTPSEGAPYPYETNPKRTTAERRARGEARVGRGIDGDHRLPVLFLG